MSFVLRDPTYTQDKAIFAFPDYISTPYSFHITNEKISLNKQGKRTVPAGTFIAKIGEENRFLPRGTVTVAPSGVRIKVENPYVFTNGDVIKHIAPYGVITVGSVAIGSVAVKGITYSYTPTGASTVQEAAVMFANELNRYTSLTEVYTFFAYEDDIYFYSTDGVTQETMTLTGSLGAGDATINAPASVGTVSYIDLDTEEIVMTGTITAAAPIGMPIGVEVDNIFCLTSHSYDLTNQPTLNLAGCNQGKVYKGHLPHYDATIKKHLPLIEVKTKWG